MLKRLALCVVLAFSAIALINNQPSAVNAQAGATGVFVAPQVVANISQCAWPSGATVTNGVAWCFVNTGTPSTSGMNFALNGGTVWTPIGQATTAGVTSFNGRTGAVTLSKADVTATSVAVSTTVTSTAVSTVQ